MRPCMRRVCGWTALASVLGSLTPISACCPVPHLGEWAVNADQTVILLWDAARKTQHFIRQASFAGNGRDFGFLIPSPTVPEVAEAGGRAFTHLKEFTKPPVVYERRPSSGLGCGCSMESKSAGVAAGAVNVLLEKRVAGFDAVVLDASSADALTQWLADHEYDYSPQVKQWAEPYVAAGWKFTALKVAKEDDRVRDDKVDAAALRLSFVTDRPLFPYREPDYGKTVADGTHRTLRIYFLGENRFAGRMAESAEWSGRTVWSDLLFADQRLLLLKELQLPPDTGPAEMRLTEFEDDWTYRVAPSDVEFVAATDQSTVHRPPVVVYTTAHSAWPGDATTYVLALAAIFVFGRGRRAAQ